MRIYDSSVRYCLKKTLNGKAQNMIDDAISHSSTIKMVKCKKETAANLIFTSFFMIINIARDCIFIIAANRKDHDMIDFIRHPLFV